MPFPWSFLGGLCSFPPHLLFFFRLNVKYYCHFVLDFVGFELQLLNLRTNHHYIQLRMDSESTRMLITMRVFPHGCSLMPWTLAIYVVECHSWIRHIRAVLDFRPMICLLYHILPFCINKVYLPCGKTFSIIPGPSIIRHKTSLSFMMCIPR